MRAHLLLTILCLPLCACQPHPVLDRTPEAATGSLPKEVVQAEKFMAVSANPYASQAAYALLARGGSAVDAAIAASMVLTLVEPQSSGLGGGAFLLYFDANSRAVQSYDGRETAPRSARRDLFYAKEKPLAFQQAVAGGRSVGVPGLLRSLELAHRQHGRLPWRELFEPAIRLAQDGFIVSPRLARLVSGHGRQKLQRQQSARDYFFPAGKPLAAGTRLQNLPLANTLRRIAASGSNAFYRGDLAAQIVNTVRRDANPGRLSLDDLASYQARERPPVCASFFAHRICGMGPPSSGGISSLQMLGLLEATGIDKQAAGSSQSVHLFAQAGRLAFADRAAYIADPDFVSVPTAGLLDPVYLKQRALLVDPQRDHGKAVAGTPPDHTAAAPPPGYSPEQPGTTHLSIIDSYGNALSMTASIEQGFGCGLMVGGFLLNNELTDFSFTWQQKDGAPIANRVQGGKRPRSSMAPTLVFDRQGKLKLVIGSPGGSRIISYVSRVILDTIVHGQALQRAISSRHYSHTNGPTLDLEPGPRADQLKDELRRRGYRIRIRELNSGLHGIEVVDGKLVGGVDPRREGRAVGE